MFAADRALSVGIGELHDVAQLLLLDALDEEGSPLSHLLVSHCGCQRSHKTVDSTISVNRKTPSVTAERYIRPVATAAKQCTNRPRSPFALAVPGHVLPSRHGNRRNAVTRLGGNAQQVESHLESNAPRTSTNVHEPLLTKCLLRPLSGTAVNARDPVSGGGRESNPPDGDRPSQPL